MNEETKPRKRRVGNPALTGDAITATPQEMSDAIHFTRQLSKLPNIDMKNADEVERRLDEYFEICSAAGMRPLVSGMAMSLNGMSRRELWSIVNNTPLGGNGNLPKIAPSVTHVIKKAYANMEMLWETYMSTGHINPVSGIFLGKNNYGYQDKQEVVVTPNAEGQIDADAIRRKYAESLPDSSDSDN